jgi:glucose/arabinose dehydrogenase
MRIAVTTAMLLAATMVCAEEPSSADTKPTPAAEATQASPAEKPAEPAATEQATTTEQNTASETTADAAEQPSADEAAKADEATAFKVPPGYRAKRINGKQMYCTATGKVTGARLSGKEQCRTEDQLRAIEKRKAEMEQR